MPGVLGSLSDQDILNLIELQRQLGQSPFAQTIANPLPPGTAEVLPSSPWSPQYDWTKALPPPPEPIRNPKRKAVEDAVKAAQPDAQSLEEYTRQGLTPPMYFGNEYTPDTEDIRRWKRKARKSV